MDYQFSDEHPIANTHTDEADIVLSLVDVPSEHTHGQYYFSRYVRADIIDEDDGGFVVVQITAFDNVNGGMAGLGSILMDGPGGDLVEFTDTIRVPHDEIEERRYDQLPQSLKELVVPDIKQWALEAEFRSEPKPFPDELRL
jgi:hypothetical protein